jgi:hypothetical protein
MAGGVYGHIPPSWNYTFPTNPGATTSTVGVMMGLKQAFTPKFSGNMVVAFSGRFGTNTASQYCSTVIQAGLGVGPNNGAARVGSQVSNTQYSLAGAPANQFSNFCCLGGAPGQAVGTAMWFDLFLVTVGGTASIYDLACVIIEL